MVRDRAAPRAGRDQPARDRQQTVGRVRQFPPPLRRRVPAERGVLQVRLDTVRPVEPGVRGRHRGGRAHWRRAAREPRARRHLGPSSCRPREPRPSRFYGAGPPPAVPLGRAAHPQGSVAHRGRRVPHRVRHGVRRRLYLGSRDYRAGRSPVPVLDRRGRVLRGRGGGAPVPLPGRRANRHRTPSAGSRASLRHRGYDLWTRLGRHRSLPGSVVRAARRRSRGDRSDDPRRLGRHVGIRIPAADAAALARSRIVAAALVLVAAAVLRYYEIPPVPTWLYVFAWYPTLLILDQLVVLLGGESLLAQPRALIAMLWWSAVIWFLFEAINLRLQDWYYVFLPVNPVERWAGITLSLATVVPAVLLPERVLDRLGVWRQLHWRTIAVGPKELRGASWLGWAALVATLAFPRYLHPFTWGAVWLIAEPVLYRTDPERSLFADIAAGSWGRIARLMAAGLCAGALWESVNAAARAKWI